MIRQATQQDAKRVWEIRNHPAARAVSGNTEEIPLENHLKWFAGRYFSGQALHKCFVLEKEGKVVGYCRYDFDDEENNYIISIAIDYDYHGKRLGTELLQSSLELLNSDKDILAEIKKDNIPSIKLFEKNQFVKYKEDDQNFHLKKEPKPLQNKRVFIFQQRGWGKNIGHFLAKNLAAEGCKLGALTVKKTTHDFIVDQKDVNYEMIIYHNDIMADPKKFLDGDIYSLKEICGSLGIDTIWPLISSLRDHVKSYGGKFYYGYRQNVSDEEILDYVMAVYKLVKKVFNEFKPDIILAPNFVILPHIMFNLYAIRQGKEMIAVTDSKVSGVNIFSYNYQDSRGSFIDRIQALNNGTSTDNREIARKYINEFRENFKKPSSAAVGPKKRPLKQRVRHQLSPYYHILRWYLKKPTNALPSVGVNIDFKPPKIILRDHYAREAYKKAMQKREYYPFDKVGKFVYFPLQFQPEESIDVIAPRFSNQIETARQIAMSLPDDYVLVVKEHPHMIGYRTPSFIEKIAKTPNIKLIDYKIPSEEVIKRADLIISPNSTTLAEAAYYNKPAIQMGDLGFTKELPNVWHHTDMTTISSLIKELIGKDLNTPEYEKQLENYVAAAYDTGFSQDYWQVWERGKKDKMDVMWEAWKNEIEKILLK